VLVTAQTGPGVTGVRLRLSGNVVDEMPPSGGVAVLAHSGLPSSPDDVVIEAVDATGKVLATSPVNRPGGPKMAFACGGAGGVVRTFQAPPPTAPPTPPTTTR